MKLKIRANKYKEMREELITLLFKGQLKSRFDTNQGAWDDIMLVF